MNQEKKIERIMIMGISGAGKSTLAKTLGEHMKIETIYLDKEFMNRDWNQKSKEEQAMLHREFMKKDRWIIEGNWSHTLDERVSYADLIIYLDCPLWFSLLRVLKRMLKNRNVRREDAAEGCYEKFSPSFYWYIIKYYYTKRKENIWWVHSLENPPVLYANTSKKDWQKNIEHLID